MKRLIPLLLLLPSTALAAEKQHKISIGPNLAILAIDQKDGSSVGGGGQLGYSYGINDQFNIAAEFGAAVVAANQQQDTPDTPHNRPAEVDHLTAGIGYVFDVLQWVPYANAMIGAYRFSGGTLDESKIFPGAQLQLGLDYQLSHHLALGAVGAYHLMFTKADTYPAYATFGLRVAYMWGW